ncbi:winged helix DNA-binding domain-containing protein [Actinopolymorpha alba]|uniref:winged helix DNA-binding domain-containing protein n=1 Tax=Actinopolymorpha alba TaxID=533267 RepID=UPI0012F6F288|nr:winged helix DNA-binding domain-containing protein [Actinopolymorpha alba]
MTARSLPIQQVNRSGSDDNQGQASPARLEVSWEQALAWRMRRQHLLERASTADLIAVVERMCGLHAQVMSSVELALSARIDGLTREAVQDALWQRRILVKLWAMRGTLHVLSASDLGVWLAGLGTYTQRYDWLKDPLMGELADLVGRALHDRLLTRAELAAAVGRLSESTAKEGMIHGGWGSFLKPASFLGQLCFGPGFGQHVRFTHPATWLDTPSDPPDADEALAAIARRFLSVYGPAAPVDLACWWGTTRTHASRMLDALGEQVTKIEVDGEPYWMLADQVAELASTTPANVVRLLPGFDQWVVCATRRDRGGSRPGPGNPALDPAYRTRIYRLQGWVSAVLLINGRIEGVWKHQRTGRKLSVEIEPFGTLPRWTRRPIEVEAERLAIFFGCDLQLTLTTT